MFYGCHRRRCRRHFELFTSQSMIEFTVVSHNAVARKQYLSTQSNAFTVDKDRCQTD